MEYRKLIKFGNSSFVISLPKSWIVRHHLKKGAIIYVDENKVGDLVCSPKEVEEEAPKTFVLDITGREICTSVTLQATSLTIK